MEGLVQALDTYGNGDKAKRKEIIELTYTFLFRNGLSNLQPLISMRDTDIVYQTSLVGRTSMPREAFMVLFFDAKEEQRDKLVTMILSLLRDATATDEAIAKYCYKLMALLFPRGGEYNLEESHNDADRFVKDFFPAEPDKRLLVLRLKEAFALIEVQYRIRDHFVAALDKPWAAFEFLCMLDGWKEDFTRQEARDYFKRDILPFVFRDNVDSVWLYFDTHLICKDDSAAHQPLKKKIKC